MSAATVALILFAGFIAAVIIAAVAWFCWRLLDAIGKLNSTVSVLSADQRGFASEVAGLRGETTTIRVLLNTLGERADEATAATAECVATMCGCGQAVGDSGTTMANALRDHMRATQELIAVAPTFTSIAGSLDELDKGIKTFLTVVVNTQVPGAMPADIVKGTPLGAGEAYPYDEAMMAEQERIRRKARGEADPDNPEVRQPEIEIV